MKYFSTILPPPNLTGVLHLGHMWNAILQDTLFIYYENKIGKDKCYWGFGVDHAGISLQIKVEEELKKQGLSKEILREEEFQKKLWEWKEIHDQKITDQYLKLGYRLPFTEKRFTLDSESVEYSLDVFKKLYKEGLIYRDEKLVNWDPKLKTAISDIEIEYRSVKGKLYTVKYYYSETEYISVSTTRPETVLGDVAIFVHPEDERYKKLVGTKVKVPLTNRYIEVLEDEYIDKEFGTGAMKCTPAHDFHDYILGKKHKLGFIKVFDGDLRMLIDPYIGLDKDKAKEEIIRDLKKEGLVTIEDYDTNLTYSSRSGAIVEPLLSKQWFLKSSVLAKEALDYWNKNREEMVVTKDTKQEELRGMLENMEDWCISRQLEWGIRIPVYLNEEEHSLEKKEGLELSKDVLDTWFSSSLWPSIVFKGRESMLPLSTLISGKDILLFWISRMVFMYYYTNKSLPFQTIFLHGLVLDSKNRKMSKSLNNGIDPLDLIKEYAHDEVRLFFLDNTHQDSNIAFSKQKLEYYSRFIHKLKNASIFIEKEIKEGEKSKYLNLNEKQILYLLNKVEKEIEEHYKSFSFHLVVKKTIDFVWERFCNEYLELYKLLEKNNRNNPSFLGYIWNRVLVLLEPLIPDFVKSKGIKEIEANYETLDFHSIDWFFEYSRVYESIRKNIGISKNQEIEIKLYGNRIDLHPEIPQYLRYLNHVVTYIGNKEETRGENTLVFAIYNKEVDMVVELSCDKNTLDKYKSFLVEEKKWLKKEIEFLGNRLRGFNDKTPKELISEVEDKKERYERDLKFYEENYKDN